MREAVVEAKLSVQETRDAVARAECDLAAERQRLADAERRGRLAAEIRDAETVAVARRFAAKHRERAAVRDELALYEREVADMLADLARAERARPLTEAERSAERAWRDLEAAGAARPETDLEGELLKARLDQAAREAAAEERLRDLKNKMRRD